MRILGCIGVAYEVVVVDARPLGKLHLHARVGIGGGAPTPGSALHASPKSMAALGPCLLAQLVLAQRACCPIQIVAEAVQNVLREVHGSAPQHGWCTLRSAVVIAGDICKVAGMLLKVNVDRTN